MPSEAPYRLSITEYRDAAAAVPEVAAALDLTRTGVVGLLQVANTRLARLLNRRVGPIQILGDALRVEDLAGLVRVSPALELEVAPKFLGSAWECWREDFFLIAILSRFGTLLARDRLTSAFAERNDLATLVGRAFVEEYWRHHRRPLRTYEQTVERAFEIDGDVDPEELALMDPEGYAQEVVRFTRSNEFNAVMYAAAEQLLTEVRDTETRQQLRRARDALAPQRVNDRRRPRMVPNRHRRWATLYDLSQQVLNGFGMTLSRPHYAIAPGFILQTPRAWEDIVVAGLQGGAPSARVRARHGWALGKRDGVEFDTTPDVTFELDGGRLVVDAKYKTREGQKRGHVSAADVYEGLAFMRAAHCRHLALLYPAPPVGEKPRPVGTAELFETITVHDLTISAFHVECRGLSAVDGLRDFGARLVPPLLALLS